jgi:thioredoxin reductase (NADPH)
MSVPCMVINDKNVYFGKKNISQVLDIIEQLT